MKLRVLSAIITLSVLSACATSPTPEIRRQDSHAAPPAVQDQAHATSATSAASSMAAGPQAQIRKGSGVVINRAAASEPTPSLSAASNGSANFNFEGESLHAVVKVILGDMLGQNYVIAPGVQGTVSLATPRAVSPAQALMLLDQILVQNNARMVYVDGRYNIVPMDQALAGAVAPRSGGTSNVRGYEVRIVPLRYISASEMKKALEPYAKPNGIVAIDSSRNLITIAGTRAELENYLRTIDVFDVDWLKGMSVGVFPLKSGRASQAVADLEKVFGENSGTPSAGMFRFLALEGANAVLVITPQAAYLDEIQAWLDRVDSASEVAQLYAHELKYIRARDLADRLAEVFGSGGSRAGTSTANSSIMPGTSPVQMTDGGLDQRDSRVDFGQASGAPGVQGTMSLTPRNDSGNGAVVLEVEGSSVGVSAVEETNTLLVRSNPTAWRSIRDVIEKLDVLPLQVHIEAQVAQVSLEGELSYGVNWYFENAVDAPIDEGGAGLPSALGRRIWGDIAGTITDGGIGWTFLGRNAAAVISALDKVTNVRMLQTPSIFARNNVEATLNVGSRIPVTSVTVNAGVGDSSYSSVQYLDTGVILKVRPRITRDGMVFLDIVQEVSSPVGEPDENGNYTIKSQKVKTEAAVHEGDTIMLAGLIEDSVTDGSRGVPMLSRLPVVGALFGTKSNSNTRSETIILLTPTIVRNPQEARQLTDDYGKSFRALEPLTLPVPR